jgi:hypothetical protein
MKTPEEIARLKKEVFLVKHNKDYFGADFFVIPAYVRGRNKTKVWNWLLSIGFQECENKDYLKKDNWFCHNHKRIGIIFE